MNKLIPSKSSNCIMSQKKKKIKQKSRKIIKNFFLQIELLSSILDHLNFTKHML